MILSLFEGQDFLLERRVLSGLYCVNNSLTIVRTQTIHTALEDFISSLIMGLYMGPVA